MGIVHRRPAIISADATDRASKLVPLSFVVFFMDVLSLIMHIEVSFEKFLTVRRYLTKML
jgi:hypothetical protein